MISLYDQLSGVWKKTPKFFGAPNLGVTVDPYIYAEQGDWGQLTEWQIYEQWTEPGNPVEGYLPMAVAEIEGRMRAAQYLAGTEESRAVIHRRNKEGEIDTQRRDVDVTQGDILLDPAMEQLFNERNDSAILKLNELDNTPDDQVEYFNAILDPKEIGATTVALRLAEQEKALAADPTMTTEQADALTAAAAAHQVIADAGDDLAEVPEPPTFARRQVGVTAESYGIMIAKRTNASGWWWLEFELHTKRKLDVDDFWVAIYSGTASDDRDDTTTGYLTTAQLVETGDGIYVADRAAVNLPKSNTSDVIKYTLCHTHLSMPQFDKLTLEADKLKQRDYVRWAGSVVRGSSSASRSSRKRK